MKIVVVSDLLRANGASIMAATQARLLHDAGDDVLLLSAAAADPDISGIVTGVSSKAYMQDDYPLDAARSEGRIRLSADLERWLHAEIEQFDPDVVICHNTGRMLDQVGVARLSRTVATIVVLHDEWFVSDAHYVAYATGELEMSFEPHTPRSLRDHDFSALWRVAAEAGTLMGVAPSKWLQNEWNAVLPSLPCLRLPYAIDPDLFVAHDRAGARETLGLDADVPVIGFAGHPTAMRKGFDLLAAAIDRLDRDVIVLVAGGTAPHAPASLGAHIRQDGWIGARVRSAIAAEPLLPGAGRSTIMLGPVPRDQFAVVMSAFDILVHPSRMDNLPTVPIEAQYCGVPCLVSAVGGSAETVVDEGATFDPNIDAAALAATISRHLDRALSESMDDRLRRRDRALQRYSPDVYLPRLQPVLRQMAGAR